MDNIRLSIEKAFAKDDTTLKEFYDRIINNLDETEKGLKKVIRELILLIVLYFLILQTSIESIEIGPLEINNVDLILKTFPILISYKFYEFAGLQCLRRTLHQVINETIKKLYPKVEENNLDYFLKAESVVTTQEIYEIRNPGFISRFTENFRTFVLVVQLLLVPLVFVVYAIIVNFLKFGFNDILVWPVFIIVIIFLLQSTLLIIQSDAKSNNN